MTNNSGDFFECLTCFFTNILWIRVKKKLKVHTSVFFVIILSSHVWPRLTKETFLSLPFSIRRSNRSSSSCGSRSTCRAWWTWAWAIPSCSRESWPGWWRTWSPGCRTRERRRLCPRTERASWRPLWIVFDLNISSTFLLNTCYGCKLPYLTNKSKMLSNFISIWQLKGTCFIHFNTDNTSRKSYSFCESSKTENIKHKLNSGLMFNHLTCNWGSWVCWRCTAARSIRCRGTEAKIPILKKPQI